MNSGRDNPTRVFPNIQQHYNDHRWLCERGILAARNDSVGEINRQILASLPGVAKLYSSVDTMVDPDQAVYYPTEFLNSQEPSGMPPH